MISLREHAELERLSRELPDGPLAAAAYTLAQLSAAAQRHLDEENRDLAGTGGNAECHIDERGAILKSLAEVREVRDDSRIGAEVQRRVIRDLKANPLDLLPGHVQEMDVGVAKHRVRQRFEGAPVRMPLKPSRVA